MFTFLESGMQQFKTVCCIDKEVNLLKLTIKPGEFIDIGKDIRSRIFRRFQRKHRSTQTMLHGNLILYEAKYWRKTVPQTMAKIHVSYHPTTLNQISHRKHSQKSAVLSKRIKTTTTDNIQCWHGNTVYYISATSFCIALM